MASHESSSKTQIVDIDWQESFNELFDIGVLDCVEEIAQEVKTGVSQLWECTSEKYHGYCITRVEKHHFGNELVIVYVQGSGLRYFFQYFLRFAKQHQMVIRCHVETESRKRMYESLGFEFSEYVLRLGHGRG